MNRDDGDDDDLHARLGSVPSPATSRPATARWMVVRAHRRSSTGLPDNCERDVLAEVEGALTLLVELSQPAAVEIEVIVARARARGTSAEVRFEREDLLDLRDALGAALDAKASLAVLVARALDAHAELVWTTWTAPTSLPSSGPTPSRALPAASPSRSEPAFASHVLASGGVVFGVMAEVGVESTDPVVFLAADLAGHGYALASNGEIVATDGSSTGWAWWSAPAETYADRPWHVERSPCPFLGACLGYIGVRALWGEPEEDNLWNALARTARGVIARLDDDRARSTVTLQRRSLSSVWGRHGIDDGAALVTRDPGPYFDDVVARIRAAAATVGAKVYTFATCHNPIRRVEWDERGATIAETPADRQRWESIEVELWLRDVTVTDPPVFGPLAALPR